MFKLETEIKAKPFPGIPQGTQESAFDYLTRVVTVFTDWIENPISVDVVLTSDKPKRKRNED